jgi:hypothetical protein
MNRSLVEQQRGINRLMDLTTTLCNECDSVWACMSRMPLATVICSETAVEIIVLLVQSSSGLGERYEELPHPRALADNVTYQDVVSACLCITHFSRVCVTSECTPSHADAPMYIWCD